MPELKVYITETEVAILRVFFEQWHMTNTDIAAVLRTLAAKLEK